MKQCPKCRAEGIGPKPLTDFCKGSGADGLQHACRVHTREYNRQWAKLNPEKNREKGKRFREANPKAYREIDARTNLKRKYGISKEQYLQMLSAQDGCCAICERPLISVFEVERPKPQAELVTRVDHDHATGKVRGLLCFSCNVGLGKFRDDKQLLLKAVRYLDASPTVQSVNRSLRESEGERGPVYQERDPNRTISRVTRREELSPFPN